jgi:hypothetical protein
VRNTNFSSEAGISIIEMMVVIILTGLIIAPVYTIVITTTNLGDNEDRVEMIRYGLGEHMRIFGTLPCPARIDAEKSDADYADANCAGAISTTGPGGQSVLIGAVPISELRLAMDCTERTGTLPDNLDSVFRKNINRVKSVVSGETDEQQQVLAGSKCVSRKHIADEYGNKFLYAVTESATNLSGFNPLSPTAGDIQLIDQNDNQTTANNQIYLLLGFGKVANGAYDEDGIQQGSCGSDSAALENENCDNDAIFRDMPHAEAIGPGHFDDMLEFSLAGGMKEDNFWNWSEGATANERNMVFNPNSRILLDRVNTVSQSDKLVVGRGNIRVDSAGAAGGNLSVKKSAGGAGGNIASENVRAAKEIEAKDSVVSEKFCYDPPLFGSCGN